MTHRETTTPDGLPIRDVEGAHLAARTPEEHMRREWLVTNGLGGYASGTVTGAITRRFHGLLVAAMPSPLGRVMLLHHLAERLEFADGTEAWLGISEQAEHMSGGGELPHLTGFRLEGGLPIWRFEVHGCTLERAVVMPHGENTVHVRYAVVAGTPPTHLSLRPLVGFRRHEDPVDSVPLHGYSLLSIDKRIEVRSDTELPALRFVMHAASGTFTVDNQATRDVRYLLEQQRGYDHEGHLWSPGYFRSPLAADATVTFIASTESWEAIAAQNPDEVLAEERARRVSLIAAAVPETRAGVPAELVIAADQFIIRPTRDGGAPGTDDDRDRRTIVAGYHWFTDWGRDTMISLEGLTLLTGRHGEARHILHEFARHVRDGLVPNFFPEGAQKGVYHTADASLWFFHAVHRYARHTGDTATVDALLPVLVSILEHHEAGTRFGIGMTEDGLLTQGAPGYQLTWMDAKVDDWVVTPRRGKAVEINALWYNALALTHDWLEARGAHQQTERFAARRDAARLAFNERFWNPETGYLFDVVDGEAGNDAACRPNQIFAIALDHPVLERERWAPVVEAVTRHLATPVGLRSLAPSHPDYKPRYFGDLRTRDAAYHQGTVWGWLVGPYVDARLAVDPTDVAGARASVLSLFGHLDEGCIGSVSEIFDAEPPYEPRGCLAQAWSVAELLRAHVRTAGG